MPQRTGGSETPGRQVPTPQRVRRIRTDTRLSSPGPRCPGEGTEWSIGQCLFSAAGAAQSSTFHCNSGELSRSEVTCVFLNLEQHCKDGVTGSFG